MELVEYVDCNLINSLNWIFTWDKTTYVRNFSLTKSELAAPINNFCIWVVWGLYGIPPEQQRLYLNGKNVLDDTITVATWLIKEGYLRDSSLCSNFGNFINVTISARLLGGKGGFGALLRGQRGARRRVRNFDACRDLSGRRVRHVKAMERLTAWLEKKKRDDELVAALGGESAEVSVRKLKKYEHSHDALQRAGQNYMGGLQLTQSQTFTALQRHLTNSTSVSSSSSSSSSASVKVSNGGTLKVNKANALDSRYIQDISFEEADEIDSTDEWSDESLELLDEHVNSGSLHSALKELSLQPVASSSPVKPLMTIKP